MPEKQSPQSKTVSRSLGFSIGVTEVIYLLGITLLASGISLAFGIAWALMVTGAVLLCTAIFNDLTRKGSQ